MTQRIFVYGTLRSGEENHHYLVGARKLGEHMTLPRFTLWDFGRYPGATSHGMTSIIGEVYQINKKLLVQLDLLEEFPLVYDRLLIPTPWGKAWMYLLKIPHGGKRIISGDWGLRRSTFVRL